MPYINAFWPNMARSSSWDFRSFISFVRAVENCFGEGGVLVSAGEVVSFWRGKVKGTYAREGACGTAFVAAVWGRDYLLGVCDDGGEGGVDACEVLGDCL